MAGRTYRYFRGDALYRFGDGLSFSRFYYSNLRLAGRRPAAAAQAPESVVGDPVNVTVTVENAGTVAGDEVIELYVDRESPQAGMPFRTLQAFRRVHFNGKESKPVDFTLSARQLAFVDESGMLVESPGVYTISVGGQQPEPGALAAGRLVQRKLMIRGGAITFPP